MGLSQQNFSPPKVDQADAVQQMRNNIERNFKTMQDAFLALDKDRSGAIDREEMKHAVARWNLPLPGPTVDALMDACDADGSGGVDYREFINVLSRDNHVYKSSQLTKEKLNQTKNYRFRSDTAIPSHQDRYNNGVTAAP